jgi:predicted nucleic acid-binding protein
MGLDTIVIDNTVFNVFIKIQKANLSNILRNVISGKVLVPSEIVNEMNAMQDKYPEYISQLESLRNQIARGAFFMHCHSYDSTVLEFAQEEIDKGEAEAIAQCRKRRIKYFITDDRKCLPFINKNYQDVHTNSSFLLISLADLHGLLPEYETVFIEYLKVIGYSKMGLPKKAEFQIRINTEYKLAMQMLGVNADEKFIKNKTDINTILNKKAK